MRFVDVVSVLLSPCLKHARLNNVGHGVRGSHGLCFSIRDTVCNLFHHTFCLIAAPRLIIRMCLICVNLVCHDVCMRCRYSELAGIIDPENAFKADRSLILDDAIQLISHLRDQTSKQQQLNRQLQEQLVASEARYNISVSRSLAQQGVFQFIVQSPACST